LFTHQRTLDIRFVDDELALHHSGRIRGSAFTVSDDQFTKIKELSSQSAAQSAYEAQVVTDTSFENVPAAELRGSIQVGALGRETNDTSCTDDEAAAKSVPKPGIFAHRRRRSIQVGADLAMLRKISTGKTLFTFAEETRA